VRSLSSPASLGEVPPKQHLLDRIARPLPRLIAEAGLATNRFFAGFRPYREGIDFRRIFRQWLAACPTDTLIMCHPGLRANDLSDPIAGSRPGEFDYLASDEFLSDALNAGVAFKPVRSGIA